MSSQINIVDFFMSLPAEKAVLFVQGAKTHPEQTARDLSVHNLDQTFLGGKSMSEWFNSNASSIQELGTLLTEIKTILSEISEEDLVVVKDVVARQAKLEAYYGWGNMYAVTDARRAAGIADADDTHPHIHKLAFKLQFLYDAMPDELKTEARDYLQRHHVPKPVPA